MIAAPLEGAQGGHTFLRMGGSTCMSEFQRRTQTRRHWYPRAHIETERQVADVLEQPGRSEIWCVQIQTNKQALNQQHEVNQSSISRNLDHMA